MMKVSVRKESEENQVWIDGYASIFNHRSKLLFEDGKFFYEEIQEGAFDEVLESEKLNVKAVVEHDDTKMLGRSKSKTLILGVDERGLKYSILWGNTQLHRDTMEMIERGDLYESSFKFVSKKGNYQFVRDQNGELIRKVFKVDALYDVSLVGDGAYSETDIQIRSAMDEFEATERQIEEMKNKLKEIENDITRITEEEE